MIWQEGTPKAGDIIRVKVRFYHHYGIFVTEDRILQFGYTDNSGHTPEEIVVLATDLDTFLAGGQGEVGIPDAEEKKRMRAPKKIVAEAERRLGEGGYDILHNNCEHFVNECAFGQHTSAFLSGVRERLRQKLGKED